MSALLGGVVRGGPAGSQRRAESLIVREATEREREAWDDLLARFPGHLVFQRAAWLRSIEAATGARPLHLVLERDREIVGCVPGFLLRKGPVRIFGSPFVGWQTDIMGPAFDPARVTTAELCAPLLSYLVGQHGVHHVEIASALLDTRAMQPLGFHGAPVYSYQVPLWPDEEPRMLRAMKDSARRNIKRAARLGLVARLEAGDDAFVDEHYDQIREVFTRRGAAMPFGKRRLAELVRHMRADGRLLAVAVYLPDGRCTATATFTMHGGVLRLWMWAHRTADRWYRPTELLTWTAMRHAAAEGCVLLDFAGGGDFKAVFGAVPDVSVVRWIWSRWAWLGRLRASAHALYRWQQAARGRLARRFGGAAGRAAASPSDADAP